MLGRFQGNLGNISSEIRTLQEQSQGMSVKLRNRKAFEERLGGFLDNVAISSSLIEGIVNNPVDESYQVRLMILCLHPLILILSLKDCFYQYSPQRYSKLIVVISIETCNGKWQIFQGIVAPKNDWLFQPVRCIVLHLCVCLYAVRFLHCITLDLDRRHLPSKFQTYHKRLSLQDIWQSQSHWGLNAV